MQLELLDWTVVVAFFVIALAIGAIVSRRAGQSSSEFFLSGRHMPWWLLGFSMVATTFAADTPLLVTDIVRKNGVAGNWVWWAFLLTGMLTVFVYAKLWRRSGVLTDIEFYELRYSGRPAAFLRGFRAIYLGAFFNVLVMANVTLAAIKIGGVMLNLDPLWTVLIASTVAVCFSAMGGLRGVLLTDFLLFIVAMVGSVGAAYVALDHPDVGSLRQMLEHDNVRGKMSILPDFDLTAAQSANTADVSAAAEVSAENEDSPEVAAADSNRDARLNLIISIFLFPLAVQWWSFWYPGAEPGGGGYIAQRMLAAKDEKHATGATLFFNAAHYALRPWPWILVALASLIVFPDLDSLKEAYPDLAAKGKVDHDLAYPAMLTLLPVGLRGLVVASLIAAFMSTISTHLNWGSSYVVNDYWKRFISQDAGEKELVRVGRVSTVLMMVLACGLALSLESALQGFGILLQVGAGTGLLFILRWFWWRLNPFSELTAMVVSFGVALIFFVQSKTAAFFEAHKLTESVIAGLMDDGCPAWLAERLVTGFETWQELLIGVGVTTVCWVLATYITPADDEETLRSFYRLIRPGGAGWRRVVDRAAADGVELGDVEADSSVAVGLQCMIAGCVAVYCTLFATGKWLYGQYVPAAIMTALAIASSFLVVRLWNKVTDR